MRDLTERQREVLDFVAERIADTGRAPTRAEIQTAFKFRSATASLKVLRALEKKRYIHLQAFKHRGITVIRQ